jgi:hypothetical protein
MIFCLFFQRSVGGFVVLNYALFGFNSRFLLMGCW